MKYTYGMRLRGFSPGCQPKQGLIRAECGYKNYHNILLYDRKLSKEEIDQYELDFISEIDKDKPVEFDGVRRGEQA